MIELKNCPCCGSKAKLWVNGGVYVKCTTCLMRTDSREDCLSFCDKSAIDKVVDAWNRRDENGAVC